ncbi:hypothetical protein MA20_21240 [Bradyrhizobium japonicum]|uniref:Uncharacterized protein n=1 Tax=Bradyrhizobium japonicum TaxID=375 RepID=A0A0A3YU12_BRAJP|nr:hypothetical protein MA20_21240 [Bradyrhizobium japonicum]
MPIPPIERQSDVAQMSPDRAQADALVFGNLEHRTTFALDDRLARLQIAQELSDLACEAGDSPLDQPTSIETSGVQPAANHPSAKRRAVAYFLFAVLIGVAAFCGWLSSRVG